MPVVRIRDVALSPLAVAKPLAIRDVALSPPAVAKTLVRLSACVKKRCRVGLLDRIFGKHCGKKHNCSGGCAEPACGCEAADPGCGCEAACGCEAGKAPAAAPEAAEPKEAAEQKDEVGPAPVVDPSAFLPTQRRFIQTNLVR